MDILIKAGQLLLSLSILIVLHELGHFIPAKLFKTKVEKFYLFFDPGFSLFKLKRGDTEYGIGWLPLGGYVKISGMEGAAQAAAQALGVPLQASMAKTDHHGRWRYGKSYPGCADLLDGAVRMG
jgi:membrane-associated protease RseP (regulator of RpoE activity)